MRSNILNKSRGFSLIELLVVISIIGVLTGIVVVSVGPARDQAQNSKKATDISQYVLNLRLLKERNGTYPSHSDNWNCLGDYSNGRCWADNFVEDSNLNNELLKMMGSLPVTEDVVGNYQGYIYRCRNSCNGFEVRWFLHGTNRDCEPGVVISPDYSGRGNTYCKFVS